MQVERWKITGLSLVAWAVLALPLGAMAAAVAGRDPAPLRFERACEPGRQLTIAAVGDVLLHSPLQKQAVKHRDGFASLWAPVERLLGQADVTYANLEGPVARALTSSSREVKDPGFVFDGQVYTSYPMFNYHPRLITDLLRSGVDVVSTANNHSLDRRSDGVNRTLEALEREGLSYTGSRRRGDVESPWYTITRQGGVNLAWIACTFSTNGIPDPHRQVLHCYEQEELIHEMIAELGRRSDVDGVIVTPHWGVEYEHQPRREERALGRRFLDTGALAVIGAHPHVLQPWEKYRTRTGEEKFIIYSLGNFVSGQAQLARRTTVMLYLGLTQGADGRIWINGARYVPLVMAKRAGVYAVRPLEAHARDAEAFGLVRGLFGAANGMVPDEALVTNPECAGIR